MKQFNQSSLGREQKIKFLHELKEGKTTVDKHFKDNGFVPSITDMWVSGNGEHFSMKTGQTLNDKEFEDLKNSPAWLL